VSTQSTRRAVAQTLFGAFIMGAALNGVGLWRAHAQGREPAGPSNTEILLKRVLAQQISALNAESADAVMLCFHSEAPDREGMREVMVNQFRVRDLRYSLKSAKFVAEDGQYAYMRTWQVVDGRNEKTPFLGETEELLVFRKGRGGWKAWTSARLDQKRVPLPGERRKRSPRGPVGPGGR
jgi:hypothetical protein